MKTRHTVVTIEQGDFCLNGEPTYKGRFWQGHRIEGLLMNSRMIQGIFDDKNPETVGRWAYPDTGVWDPERNTREFIEQMPVWKEHGLLAFTLGLQGGSPDGYNALNMQPAWNSAFLPDGSLDPAYMSRLERILDRADELGMVVILNYFYFGQDRRLAGETAVKQATANATAWLMMRGYRNVMIDMANECDMPEYTTDIVKAPRVHELLELARLVATAIDPSYRLLVSSSVRGTAVPNNNIIEASDFILIHGNSSNPIWLNQQAQMLRNRSAYRGQPIVNNEDDHFDFDKDVNHFVLSVKQRISWGYFDPEGFQNPPVRWDLNTGRKRAFFAKLKEITGV